MSEYSFSFRPGWPRPCNVTDESGATRFDRTAGTRGLIRHNSPLVGLVQSLRGPGLTNLDWTGVGRRQTSRPKRSGFADQRPGRRNRSKFESHLTGGHRQDCCLGTRRFEWFQSLRPIAGRRCGMTNPGNAATTRFASPGINNSHLRQALPQEDWCAAVMAVPG